MPTPSLQTLVTDAQSVLALQNMTTIRSTMAVALANANTGTPLSPLLTNQQLINEARQVMTLPKSDIESIIVNQLMKFLNAPPAPGGAGADKQVIWNDAGVLTGDTNFTWDGPASRLTVSNATITGNLTVDTNTFFVDSTNDKVGVGTTSLSSEKLTVAGNVSANAWIGRTNISAPTADVAIYRAADNTFAISTANTERLRVDVSGNLGLGVTPSAGAGVLQLSSGINFPATQVASANANTLDDYEEGTFTPTVRGSSTAGTGTYTQQSGWYTKVGRLVTVNVWIIWTGSTGTGNLQFGGLPFATNSASGNYNGISIAYINNVALTASNVPYGFIDNGATVVQLQQAPTGGGAYSNVPLDTAGEISFTATFWV